MASGQDDKFPTTRWTLISHLRSEDWNVSSLALEAICKRYQFPLYCYIRRRGLPHHDAEDVLHGFMAKLLRLDSLKSADMAKGRLRGFLTTALQRYLINWRRDGQHRLREVSIESTDEARYEHERFSDEVTPEMALDRIWAATLLRSVLDELAVAEDNAGKGAHFEVLAPFLSPMEGACDYDSAAKALGQSATTVRQAVRRLRDKFRVKLRIHVAKTLRHPSEAEVDEEIRNLRDALTN